MGEMIEVTIDSIRVSLVSPQRVVLLRELRGQRLLPIWIGPYEAEAIQYALHEVEVARPLTHDLLKNVFHALGARVLRVEVVKLQDNVFYGNIVAEVGGRVVNIDARPSDALALAVRTHVPILVAKEVMDAAGIVPEEDLQRQDEGREETTRGASPAPRGSAASAPPEESAEPTAAAGGEAPPEERLSIFEDFLEQLEGGDSPATEEDDEPDE
ncbi:MAG: bifunctional nuclease family protein [Chloroflexi bacterium]|nr:bifunctional nuclease family protein [Chloroflexota bacterium]